MDIEISPKVQHTFKPALKRPLTDVEIAEVIFNLKGFALTLLKMKTEVNRNAE